MASSTVKEEAKPRNEKPKRVGLTPAFFKAFSDAVVPDERGYSKFSTKKFVKQNCGSLSITVIQQPVSGQDEFSTSDDKVSENQTEKFPDSFLPADSDLDTLDNNRQRLRRSKSFNRSNSNRTDAAHNNTEKSYNFNQKSRTNNDNSKIKHSKSIDISDEQLLPSKSKSYDISLNSKQSFHQDDDSHIFIQRMPKPSQPQRYTNERDYYNKGKTSRIKNSSLKNVEHKSNSNQSYSNDCSINNFNKGSLNSKSSYFQGHHSNNSTETNSQKCKYFPEVSSNQHVKIKGSNPGYMSNQITNVEDGIWGDIVYENNLDPKNDFEDDDVSTETKSQHYFEICNNKSPNNSFMNLKDLKNIKITVFPDLVKNVSSVSLTMPYTSNVQNFSTLNRSNSSPPTSTLSSVSPVGFVPSDILPNFLPASNLDISPNVTLPNVLDVKSLTYDNSILVCPTDIIPPPVEPLSVSDELSPSSERNMTLFQNSESESTDEGVYEDEFYFSLPESAHIEAISSFIMQTVEERSVPFTVADKVVNDLQRIFKNQFEGNIIDYYGSYYTDLAITTSDINLVIQTAAHVKNSFMYEIYKILSDDLERYHVLPYEEGTNGQKSKINFIHPDTGINCELSYLGRYKEKYNKMGKFLRAMCNVDKRVKPLIIVTKVWAECFNINEIEDGKLHPIGFTLLVIHFLQHCETPILPVTCDNQCIRDLIEDLPQNNLSIGTLWLDFLKYYAFTFHWQEDILTVTSMDRVLKKAKQWENFWIAIEDPFTGKNIAASVINKDVADYIKSCFRHSYSYFLHGRKIPSSGSGENQSSTEFDSPQLVFSFNDCTMEQNENICEKCEEIDDVCVECKKKIYVQPPTPVPKMTDDFLILVKRALITVYNKYMLSREEVEERKQFVEKLENDVRKTFYDAELRLFGSSANGFGFKKSDVDICLTFKQRKELNAFAILRSLRSLLRRNADFVDVIAIFNAQIPILKFRYEPKGWRGDISLNNVLAIHNSNLLHTYSLIDERCKILGCAFKLLAKKALITDVTEKALSPYSYLIMVIHFLQQTDPPVLPVLQDSQFRDNFDLGDIVDNCNVWFCRNMYTIKNIFKAENNTPVEKLFIDLLDYYCFFDTDHVITIRQKGMLTLSSCKGMRSARLFNIQDPFLVNKNLGSAVSPPKAEEIKSVLNRARMLFRTPKKELPADLEDHFFSTMSLTGRIQKEVLCDNCGKFGHNQNDCKYSLPLKNKYFPRKYQFVNRNNSFRKNINRSYIREKL